MKKTLLEIVQSILNDLDSEEVNTLGDSVEALQVASIVKDVYFNIISTRDIPEHYSLVKLTALSDSNFPSHFKYPVDTKEITKVWYQNSDGNYTEIKFVEPLDFLYLTDTITSEYTSVTDKSAGTTLRIGNAEDPKFYTSFDDEYLVFNSYNTTVDSTLQESKVRAYGSHIPTFSISDDFTPDLDVDMFPYLLAEAKSTAMSILKGYSDPKVEQAARRQKNYIQNQRHNTKRANNWSNYGR